MIKDSAPVVFCRSCARDVERFELQAWSVAQHLGVQHVVCVDESDVPLFTNVAARVGGKLRVVQTPEEAMTIEEPYLRQQYVKLVSDRICGVTGPSARLFHLDSDMYVTEAITERWLRESKAPTPPWYYRGAATATLPGLEAWRPLLTFAGALVGEKWRAAWMQPYGWWTTRPALAGLRYKLTHELLTHELLAEAPRALARDELVRTAPFIEAFSFAAVAHKMSEYQLYGAYVAATQDLCGPLYHELVNVDFIDEPAGVVHRSSQFAFSEGQRELLRSYRSR